MAKVILDYKNNKEESKIIHQGDIIVMEYVEEVHTYIVFIQCEKNKPSQKMLVSLGGGAALIPYNNLGNMTHEKFKSCFPSCKVTIIPKNEAIIKIDRLKEGE